MDFEEFRNLLRNCRYCASFGIEPKPLVWGEQAAQIVQISQALSKSASECGIPFSKNRYRSNGSGKKLIEWYNIPREIFYNPKFFYITGIGHCYPGKSRGGDAKPPLECAKKWLEQELSFLHPKLYIMIGRHSTSYFFPDRNFTDLVFQTDLKFKNTQTLTLILPHPSPANKKWFKDNPTSESDRLQDVRKAVHEALKS